jgi:hypothetical protein
MYWVKKRSKSSVVPGLADTTRPREEQQNNRNKNYVMQAKHLSLSSLGKASLCALLALGFVAQIQAQDKKPDASGTWTWTMPGRNGGADRKMTLTLKADGEKVTGKLSAPNRQGDVTDTDIADGKIKGEEISFTVSREVNGNTFTTKYNGKISADAIKGKIESERNGATQSNDWEAKRAAAAAAAPPAPK